MIYVMSDLHGEYKKYIEMLKKINFGKDDVLYILGDVVDRGKEPFKILKDMSSRDNVFPIMGNHELIALELLRYLSVEITEENYNKMLDKDIMKAMIEWQLSGGNTTIDGYLSLNKQERKAMLEYMNDFSPYETIDIADKTFILVHAGLGNFDPHKKLCNYTLNELTWFRPDYNEPYFNDENIFVVCGHTPTLAIIGEAKIFHHQNHIVIDCGATFNSGKLACLCLDTMKEYYI